MAARAAANALAEAARAAAEAAAAAEAKAERAAAAEARAAEEAAAQKVRDAADAELREKRQAATEALKARRDRSLSSELFTGAVDGLLGSVAAAVQGEDGGGQAAEWAREGQEKLRVSAAAREKLDKLSLFESDLAMLGLTAEEAIAMDEKALRKVFRGRSRELHPDVVDGGEGPTVYELNAAYEAIRKLL